MYTAQEFEVPIPGCQWWRDAAVNGLATEVPSVIQHHQLNQTTTHFWNVWISTMWSEQRFPAIQENQLVPRSLYFSIKPLHQKDKQYAAWRVTEDW